MHRRAFLIGVGGAVSPPVLLAAQPVDAIAPYYERLQRGLSTAGGGAFTAATEDALLPLHNSFRAAHGLSALQRSPALDGAARAHVADLLQRRYFAHASPEGFTSEHRVGLMARRFVGAAGENIAMQDGGDAPPDAADLAKMWRDSPGHRANMLRKTYTHVGFGVVEKGDHTFAGAVFGQTYGELAEAAPFRVGRGDALAGVLDGAAPRLTGYELHPLDGRAPLGPFAADHPPENLEAGAYTIRPHAPDPSVLYRYWIMFGPIVVAG